jgi:hypothetical protein
MMAEHAGEEGSRRIEADYQGIIIRGLYTHFFRIL